MGVLNLLKEGEIMDKNVKVKYNKLENMEFNNQGYINLNETIINNKYDLANMCNIFRDPRYLNSGHFL